MIRVLHVVTSMNMGGIENFIMNYYRHIDRDKIQFDFLTHRNEKGYFDSEIESLGGRIYHVPAINPFHHREYLKQLKRFFEEHKEYQIVHSHINTFSMFVLREAKRAGVPVRISHSHATTTRIDYKTPFRYYTKKKLTRYSTDNFACSDKAGKWLFGNKPFTFFPNSIEVEQFKYNEKTRDEVREELDISDNLVLGCIANFSPIKNHSFLIDVFNEVLKTNENSRLVLVGDGGIRSQIEKRVIELGLGDKVLFLGTRNDAYRLYQAFDEFLLCSFSEGFPVSVLEAQASGLPCILSEGVPKDICVCDNISFIDVSDSSCIKKWAEKVIEYSTVPHKDNSSVIINGGFDVNHSVKTLEDFYLGKVSE